MGIGQNQRLDYSAKSPTGFNSLSEPGSSTGDLKQDPKDSGDGSPSKNSSHYSFRVDNASDLNFGPKPQLLVCECIGGSRAYRIVWTVECALPSCCVVYTGSGFTLCDSPSHFNDGTYSIPSLSVLDTNLKVTEFNYSLSWSIDESRFTTFSIVGTIELAGTIFASYIDTASST